MSIVVRLSLYERFLNILPKTNLYFRKGNNLSGTAELKKFLIDVEKEIYLRGYEDATKGDDPEFELDY